MMSKLLCLIFVISFLFSCQLEMDESRWYEAGVSDMLAIMRSKQLSEVAYNLTFDIPSQKEEEINAKLKLSFQFEKTKIPLILDFKETDDHLLSVKIKGKSVEYRFENEHIIIEAGNLELGYNEMELEFIAGELSLNRNDDYLYTLLVPDRARTVFPCFDQPDLKANYKLTLIIEEEWMASANSTAISEVIADKRKTIRFEASEPISSYLFAFATGKFNRITSKDFTRPMNMMYRESDAEKVKFNQAEIFRIHDQALKWLEEYTGIPYPFRKFDFVLIPGFQYGGMEHIGNIFYRESSLMLENNSTINQQLRRASLIAHETAHMWFGDLVTMKWFDDVWMKEVFANFMAAKIVNPQFPDINHDLRFLLAHHPSAYEEDRSKGTHPIQQALENLENAGSLYGRIIYQKAPIVMLQLEQKMGEEAFQNGLREYLQNYSMGNATWDDLVHILDKHNSDDLVSWSEVWVKEKAMPHMGTMVSDNESKLKIEITQTKTAESGKYWPQESRLILFYEDSVESIPFSIKEQKTEIALDKGRPVAFLPNGAPYSYGYFEMDKENLDALLNLVNNLADPVLRGAIRLSLYETFLQGKNGIEDKYIESVINGIKTEREPLNRLVLINQFSTIFWHFIDGEERETMSATIEKILWDLFENSEDASSKKTYFNAYKSIVSTPSGVQQLKAVYSGDVSLPEFKLSEAETNNLAMDLALWLPEEAEEIIEREITSTLNEDRKKRLMFIRPSLSTDIKIRDAFFESLKKLENRTIEPWVLTALNYLHHPSRAEESLQYILPSLEMIQEIQTTGDIFFPRGWASATLNNYNSEKAAQIVNQFLENNPELPYRLKNKILMSADILFRASEYKLKG